MAAEPLPVFIEPADIDESVWRYMDSAKFVSMLVKGIVFSRLDCLGDPFEGSFPWINTQEI